MAEQPGKAPKPSIDVLLVEIGCTCCAAMSVGRGSTEAGFLAGAIAGAVAGAGGRLTLCARHLSMWRSTVSLVGIREVSSARRVTVNCETITVESDALSYEDVVALAGKTGTPTVVWEWRAPDGGEHDGIMHPGSGTVVVRDGMIFTVMHTGNA